MMNPLDLPNIPMDYLQDEQPAEKTKRSTWSDRMDSILKGIAAKELYQDDDQPSTLG